MEIRKQTRPDALELKVSGRLDAYWADHLAAAIEESLQTGDHRLRVDMESVAYMSSAGIRILLRFRKQVQNLGGSFVVVDPSPAVRSVLEMVGLEALLEEPGPTAEAPRRNATTRVHAGVEFEVFEAMPGAAKQARFIGDPRALERDHCGITPLRLEPSVLALGLGVLGEVGDEGRARCGEFLGVGGAAAYLPVDGSGVADYVVATGTLRPEIGVAYAAACDMSAATLVRFEAPPAQGALELTKLMQACLDLSAAPLAAVAMVAESAGLLGAALRRSPVSGDPGGDHFTFAFPGIRQWLSFTPERVHARSVALVVGLVGRSAADDPTSFLRPMSFGSDAVGHFHAAAFGYRPLRKGTIDLVEAVGGLFDDGAPLGILHLLNDDRPIVGSGDSLFVRGACWVAPVAGIQRERS